MKKWEFVRDLDAEEVKELAITSIRESYKDIDKPIDYVLEYLFNELEKVTKYRRNTAMFTKYLYFLATNIEYIKTVNPNLWHMTNAEIDNTDRSKLIEEYDKHKDDEDFKEYFSSIDEYVDTTLEWSYENNIENIIKKLGKETKLYQEM